MLVNVVKGPTCFEEIRTVDSVLYESYMEACQALHLRGYDNK